MGRDVLLQGNEAIMDEAILLARHSCQTQNADFGVGFASGIIDVRGSFYTMVWCAVVSKTEQVGLGGGICVKLPDHMIERLKSRKVTEEDIERLVEGISGNPYQILVQQALLAIQSEKL